MSDYKTMSPYIYDSIHTIDDIKNHNAEHVRGYIYQLQSYLFAESDDHQLFSEFGYFIPINKINGCYKIIEMGLDLEIVEEILQKCERINKAVKTGTPPEANFCDSCDYCNYRHICNVAETGNKGAEFIVDSELQGALDLWSSLRVGKSKYDEVDKYIKSVVKKYGVQTKKDTFIIGGYEIKLDERKKTCYNVPDDVKNMYKGERPEIWTKIRTV